MALNLYFGGVTPVVLALLMIPALPESSSFQRETQSSAAVNCQQPVVNATRGLFGLGRAATTLLLWTSFFFTQLILLLMLNWLPSLLRASGGAVLLAIEPFVVIAGCAALALTWRVQTSE